jgi:hypothetical protein
VLLSSGDSFPHLIQKLKSQLGFVTDLLNYLRKKTSLHNIELFSSSFQWIEVRLRQSGSHYYQLLSVVEGYQDISLQIFVQESTENVIVLSYVLVHIGPM